MSVEGCEIEITSRPSWMFENRRNTCRCANCEKSGKKKLRTDAIFHDMLNPVGVKVAGVRIAKIPTLESGW